MGSRPDRVCCYGNSFMVTRDVLLLPSQEGCCPGSPGGMAPHGQTVVLVHTTATGVKHIT